MNLFRIFSVAVTILTASQSFSQQSEIYNHALSDYQKALELYNNKQYQSSQTIFEQVKRETNDPETEANCAYYIANAAIRLNQLGADKLMEDFMEHYPTSVRRSSAYMDVANYYFDQGKYPYALRWYDRAEGQSMGVKEREAFNFRKGYALFNAKKYNDAKKYMNKVSTSAEYGSQAKYYLGFMAYESDNYNEANQYFNQVSANPELNEKLSYYQADMNFKLGDFKKAIALAKEQLSKADPKEVSELNKIIGESYFNLGEYQACIPYLQQYKGRQGKWSNTDLYQLGYAYYKQGDYENAVSQFNKIIDSDNPVAQNAYYHLAECYLKTDKKQQALNAFKNASQMDYDQDIKRDASLNYARLSYDIGNPYESVPNVLSDYLKSYPDSPNKAEIQELLVDSYITSKNYNAALDLLEKNKGFASKEAYQKVAFYRGLELFNEADYPQALSFFERSLKEPQDQVFNARALFWKAETLYVMNNFDEAIIGFKQFEQQAVASSTPEYRNLYYDMAYAYFKQKNYTESTAYFEKFISRSTTDQSRLNDSYLRLGDSQFVSSKYWPAMEAYNKVIAANGTDSDYATFQKAMSYGFVNRTEKKIEELEAFNRRFPNSSLGDDAYYELGNTYVNNNQTAKGIEAYKMLASQYKMSSYVPKAILKEGLVYYNNNQNSEALARFKTVVRDYPNTQEAVQAVSTAKQIYVDEGRVGEYAAWVKGLDFVEVSNAELDDASFESAEKQYAQNNTDASIKGFEDYLRQFPDGAKALQAHFYVAQGYYNKGEKQKAVPHYEYVSEKERNEYTEPSLARLGELYLEANDYNRALPLLKRLEAEADYPQNVTFAQSNLMKANYELKDYPQTIAYAEKVLKNSKVDNRIKSDAHIMIARSAIATNDENRARSAYAEVQKIATGSMAAEALYYDAYFKNKDAKYEASNVAVQKLAKDYASYKEWGAKGLIVMARNFYALDDAFQATYVLDNVISNFTEYPEIVDVAKAELQYIKNKEAQRNSSVTPTDKN